MPDLFQLADKGTDIPCVRHHTVSSPPRRLALNSVLMLSTGMVTTIALADAPSQPVELRAAIYSSSSAEVTWARSTDDVIVAGYEIVLNDLVLGTFDQLSYYSDELTPGDTYRFEITAVDDEGNRSTSSSIALVAGDDSVSPDDSDPIDGAAPLDEATISDARIIVYSRTAAEVFWTRPASSRTTEIYRNGQQIGTSPGNSYYDSGRERNASYSYELVALDAQGGEVGRAVVGAPSSTDPSVTEPSVTDPSVTDPSVTDPTAEIPAAPEPPSSATGNLADLNLIVYSRTAAELFWSKADAGVTTRVFRDDTLLGNTPGNSFYDGNRQRATQYRYTLETLDDAGRVVATGVLDESGTTATPPVAQPPETPPVMPPGVTPPEVPPPLDGDVFEPLASDINPDRSRFSSDGYDPVNVIRVDLRTDTTAGVCTDDDESGCTLADVLADVDKTDDLTVDIPVHFMSDDFADDGSQSNAELRLRGGGSRLAPQKSFRIKLDSKDDLWRGERYLQLNKHPYESSRQRNKLAMDLMSRVPQLPSFRTQFVNLWIDDGSGPEDYGLFTHVERSNDDYLESRALDKDGNLYKAEEFQFSLSDLENMRVDDEGEPLDEDRFETSLEIEEGKDHRALVNMMSALHDPDRSFESVLDEYFNRNNVLAWMSVNLLFRHADGTRHNYILYNPSGTEKFYFIPWDYDAALGRWRLPADDSTSNADLKSRVNYGYSLGAENVFIENFYKLPGAHNELLSAIAYLRQNAIDDATIVEQSERNADLIEPFMTRLPDSEFNPEFNNFVNFDDTIAWNEESVQTRFNVPLPPALLTPERQQDAWSFSWTPAYSPTGDALSYDLLISSSLSFDADDIAVEITGIEDASSTVVQLVDSARLPRQTYYVRVIARADIDPGRFWTPARNRVVEGGTRYYGMIRLDTD